MGNEQGVTIDLTRAGALTPDSVRQLLASASDTTMTELRVTKAGIAFIAPTQNGAEEPEDLAFRLETWIQGTHHVGAQAAEDDEWVDKIYRVLKANWPNPTTPIVDWF